MKGNTQDIAKFFSRISDTYGKKYENADAFHHYFFNERLDEAVRDLDLAGKRILDIGAGTGPLYDRLIADYPSIDYYAIDISEGMLSSSKIPEERRFVGTLDDVNLPVSEFNHVFLLGVTTYLSDKELKNTLERVYGLLSPTGSAVVTFTNRTSVDWTVRSLARRTPGLRRAKRSVIGQGFQTYARSLADIEGLVSERFSIDRVVGLNHTVFPFNQVFKGASVRLARHIHPGAVSRKKLAFSSDILVEISRLP